MGRSFKVEENLYTCGMGRGQQREAVASDQFDVVFGRGRGAGREDVPDPVPEPLIPAKPGDPDFSGDGYEGLDGEFVEWPDEDGSFCIRGDLEGDSKRSVGLGDPEWDRFAQVFGVSAANFDGRGEAYQRPRGKRYS